MLATLSTSLTPMYLKPHSSYLADWICRYQLSLFGSIAGEKIVLRIGLDKGAEPW